jgi:hypothetical protein
MEVRRSQRKLNGVPGSRSDAQFADVSMENRTGLLLVLLLALVLLLTGCRSGPDGYLAQAINHATAADVEQVLGHPTADQALETGQRRWLYHREGDGTGGREWVPYCHDLWLTFDREGVLRSWMTQRC